MYQFEQFELGHFSFSSMNLISKDKNIKHNPVTDKGGPFGPLPFLSLWGMKTTIIHKEFEKNIFEIKIFNFVIEGLMFRLVKWIKYDLNFSTLHILYIIYRWRLEKVHCIFYFDEKALHKRIFLLIETIFISMEKIPPFIDVS